MRNTNSDFFFNNFKKSQVVKNPASKISGFLFECLESVITALIVVVILMTFFFRVANVSGNSMMDTLNNGDKILISKFNYIPKNGDVVAISRGQNLDEPIIKRIIATEGQALHIDFTNGSVFVNGIKLNETYIKEPMQTSGDGEIPSVIPKGCCFVMGDNRNNSLDSRSKSVGLIENKNIMGKATFIIFSFYRAGIIK